MPKYGNNIVMVKIDRANNATLLNGSTFYAKCKKVKGVLYLLIC